MLINQKISAFGTILAVSVTKLFKSQGNGNLIIMGTAKTAVDRFDEFAELLKPHPIKAQILLEVNDEGETLQSALTVLKTACIHPIEYNIFRKEYPACILVFLSSEDMTQATLKLSEAGFTKVKGINPRHRGFELKDRQ